jgi:hypothetical protein
MCDDGNNINGDGCDADCFINACRPGGAGSIPGYCGSRANDCVEQLCTVPPTSQDGPGGLPSNIMRCKQGDPTCDASPASDRVCTFRFSLCYNFDETRYPCAKNGVIERVKFRRPNQDAPRSSLEHDNRDAIEAALIALGGTVSGKCRNPAKRGQPCSSDVSCDSTQGSGDGLCMGRSVIFNPPLTAKNICSPLINFKVGLKQSSNGFSFGHADLRIRSHEKKPGHSDGDILKFFCVP